jgi:phosphoglycolate phosphatase-like HAD superfamily hydrolase
MRKSNFRASGVTLSVLTSLPKSAGAKLLETHQLSEFFCRVDGAGSLNFRKPAAGALLSHLAHLQVAPENAAYVGDDVKDMKMAKEARVFGIGVAWSSFSLDALKQAGAKTIVTNIADIRILAAR